jgi:hypothetical protein
MFGPNKIGGLERRQGKQAVQMQAMQPREFAASWIRLVERLQSLIFCRALLLFRAKKIRPDE